VEADPVPAPIVGAGLPRPNLGGRWLSRLVATAEENRLNFRRSPHTSFAAASNL